MSSIHPNTQICKAFSPRGDLTLTSQTSFCSTHSLAHLTANRESTKAGSTTKTVPATSFLSSGLPVSEQTSIDGQITHRLSVVPLTRSAGDSPPSPVGRNTTLQSAVSPTAVSLSSSTMITSEPAIEALLAEEEWYKPHPITSNTDVFEVEFLGQKYRVKAEVTGRVEHTIKGTGSQGRPEGATY